MNRRVRNPSGSSSSPSKIQERLHRYLRPGALARLRDTRINSRCPRSAALLRSPFPNILPRLSPPSSPTPSDGAAGAPHQFPQIDGFPCFASRLYGPSFPQRKRLLATKTMLFMGSIPSSPVGLEPPDSPLLDVFNADLLIAH